MTGETGRDVSPRGLTRADLMTAGEVAQLLSVPVSTVQHWGRNGALSRVKLGRHVHFVRAHVERAILNAIELPSAGTRS
jgi:excisionase family DNA binding protein